MPSPQRKYPWEPLWAFAVGRRLSMSELARRVGSASDGRELYRWREAGGVPEAAADRVAVALGVLPDAIWPEWHEVAEADRRAKAAAKMRRFRALHPDYAERQRAGARRYKAEARDYVLAYNRAYNREWRAKKRFALQQMDSGGEASNVA